MYLTDDEREQLQQIQAGNEIARQMGGSLYSPVWQVVSVERVTAKQIVLTTGDRYWKKSGKEVGGSDTWSNTEIFPLTDRVQAKVAEAARAFAEQQRRTAATKLIRNTTWRFLSLDVLEQIVALIEAATD